MERSWRGAVVMGTAACAALLLVVVLASWMLGKSLGSTAAGSTGADPSSRKRGRRWLRDSGSSDPGNNGVITPTPCEVFWSVTTECTGNCRGAIQVEEVTSVTEATNGGAPCSNEVGDVRTTTCDDEVHQYPCYCDASQFTTNGPDGPVNNFYDAATAQTCGACELVGNNVSCYFCCQDDAPGSLQGDASVTCINGAWSIPQNRATCQGPPVQCPAILEDLSMAIAPGGVCMGAQYQDVCSIYCKPGYVLQSSVSTATCSDGQWSAALSCTWAVDCQMAPS